ncbi:MAG: enoyl-CoA hydratase/isomerase family protein [bacterium]|nr:enoyl-CoA hydratase/isomerase family protein [bacterium]MCP5045044.1 enoyl-CoA hydratase/isomerase family protein [bacterium]
MPEILVEKKDHVGIIIFNRPEKMNTISGAMLAGLSESLVALDRDDDIRVIVLTGAGKAFCAGLDLQAQAQGQGFDGESGSGVGGVGALASTIDLRDAPPAVLHNVEKPVICALNGGAAGYGMDIALGCDIRIAAESAKMSAAFTKRGVIPESGGTWLLPRIVGWSRAAEIMFTGRKLDAAACLEYGIVNEVVPADQLMDVAMDLAREVAGNAPLAVQATKRMMRMAQVESFEANIHHVFLQLLPLFKSKDFVEGFTAFLEKREPEFHGR